MNCNVNIKIKIHLIKAKRKDINTLSDLPSEFDAF